MGVPRDPSDRQPKGDRRLSLGFEPEDFPAEAGVKVEAWREYVMTSPDHDFNLELGEALERLEAVPQNSTTGQT